MKKNNRENFFTSFLLNQNEFEPSKIKAIFNLIEKNIFQLYNIEKATNLKENNEIDRNKKALKIGKYESQNSDIRLG